MKYMLLIHFDEQAWGQRSLADRERVYWQTMEVARELTSSGQYLGGNPLHPTSVTTSVRVRDGKRLVIDGPFVETREQLGGYMLIDVKDLEEALDIAARIPLAHFGTIEVRPVREGPPTAP
jgi:hypothetical protein